jgi:hypothetical protein
MLILSLTLTNKALALTATAPAPRYIGELHPPVVVSEDNKKLVVYFLKSNFKNSISEAHIAAGEIFYVQVHPLNADLKYIWKIEGEEVTSVFFYDWKTPSRAGKTMYVLTRSPISSNHFNGVLYSTLAIPIISEGDTLSLIFFPGDPQDPKLQSCYEGIYLETKKATNCTYKNAGAIKKYLADQDK